MLLRRSVLCPLLTAVLAFAASAQTYTFNFSTPVQIGPTEAPGIWYPDRFPPNGFISPEVAPNGTPNALQETIAASDLQAGTNFYNTQGRKYDIPPTTTSVTIFLYVPAAWATQNAREAGFWTTVFQGATAGDFPIIEFQGPITSQPANGPSYQPNGGVAGFYGWNNMTGSFQFIGLPAGFQYNTFVQLTITFLPPNGGFIYTVGNLSLASPQSVPNETGIGNVILEGYNYGTTYSIFWDGGFGLDTGFQTHYSANLNIGESYIDIANDGANGASLLGPGFGAAAGNLCVNVYAFDPNEELVSCCSCLVTPDQTVHLGVNADLTSKTLTGVVPTSVTVKLVATLAGAGGSGTGTVCNNSAASITSTTQAVLGLAAWGTTLHQTPTAGTYTTTETPFTPSTLSTGELASIVGRCAAIIGNASGFGICTSCHNGALGAAKL